MTSISRWARFKEDRVRQHIDRRIVCDDLVILYNVEGVCSMQPRGSLRELWCSPEVPLNIGADRAVESKSLLPGHAITMARISQTIVS